MNDFILVHAYGTSCEYLPTLIRISNIKSVETRTGNSNYRAIYMKDDSYYMVKEPIEEIYKMIKENGN